MFRVYVAIADLPRYEGLYALDERRRLGLSEITDKLIGETPERNADYQWSNVSETFARDRADYFYDENIVTVWVSAKHLRSGEVIEQCGLLHCLALPEYRLVELWPVNTVWSKVSDGLRNPRLP